MAKSTDPIITVSGLTKHYGKQKVVNDLSFDVKKDEIFGILGPNGAGKTTTLETIEAIRPIEKGEVTIAGMDVRKSPHAVKQIIGIQLQSSSFYDKMTLRELLEMFASFYGRTIDPMKALKDVELTEKADSYFEFLSGGQKQRFSIAAALVNKPQVLFLDEPTTGLDPQSRRHLWELISSIKKRGITVVLTTHYMDEAQLLSDRIAIMDEGRIIAQDTPRGLIKTLLDKGFKKTAEVEKANLEDVFIDLTGKELRE